MHHFPHRLAATLCAASLATFSLAAGAADATILHVFGGKKDGDGLSSPLIVDAAGRLFGSSTVGGAHGGGIVFELVPPAAGQGAWTEQVLFDFAAANVLGTSATGSAPRSSLWFGDGGTLLGTTSGGAPLGAGNVFQLTPPASGTGAWTQGIVHTFASGDQDAGFPEGMPIARNASTTRYGTTLGGGPANVGALYSIAPPKTAGAPWRETLLFSFSGPDGALPINDLLADAKGNLYGVTEIGGAKNLGTVFRLSPPKTRGGAWTQTTLHTFTGGADGRAPDQKLTIDAQGALWGTTASGGSHLLGNIFRLSPPARASGKWVFENMHEFADAPAGQSPHSGLTPDGAGGFYGTTGAGGAADCGTIFHFVPQTAAGAPAAFTTLSSFTGGQGGAFPYGHLLLSNGVLYGSTFGSTSSDGLSCDGSSVAFRFVP